MLGLVGQLDANILQALVWSALGAGLLVSIIFYSVITMIVVSFLAPQSSHPAVVCWELTEPVIAPLRQVYRPWED